jgi:DNA invertase Pin-like site-specific DNA recombinase
MSVNGYPTVAIYAGAPLTDSSFAESIGQQVGCCWNYSVKRKWKVVHIFVDQGRKESLVRRRNFRNMVKKAKTGSFNNIVLYRLGYFCESQADVVSAEKLLRWSGIPFHCIDETERVMLMLPSARGKVKL